MDNSGFKTCFDEGNFEQGRRQFITGGAAVAGLILLPACSPSSTVDLNETLKPSVKPGRLVTLNPTQALFKINRIRSQHSARSVSSDARLMKAARKHARLMARNGRMGHSFGPGTGFARRMKDVGFDGSAGENLGVGYRSVDAAIQGWMNSPPHRKIMLRRNFNIAGIGLAKNPTPNSRVDNFWVLIMGSGGGPYLRGAS